MLSQIREIPAISDIPVIFLTGKSDRESVVRVIEARPNGYILKSASKEDLLKKIDAFFMERQRM